MDLDLPSVKAASKLASARGGAADRMLAWLGREGLVVLLACGFAMLEALQLRRLLSSDGWLDLVAGRYIVHHGLPSHDTLATITHGRDWVDQQWLAHVMLYGLQQAGGYRLVVAVVALLVIASFAGALALARRDGGSPRLVAVVGLIAILPVAIVASVVSAQAFAYVLFVLLLAILLRPGRLSWRQLAVLLPMLVLWGNLHGSAVLAAGLVSLRGAVEGFDSLRGGRRPGVSAAAVVLPWVALACSPYAPGLPQYYAHTILNPGFGRYLAIWQPSTLSIYSLPLFALVFGLVWLLGRAGDAYTRFEKLAVLALSALALLALRNWVWLSLLAIVLVPRGLDAVRASRGARPFRDGARANVVAGVAGLALFLVLAASQVAHPQRWYVDRFSDAAGRAVTGVVDADPHAKVYASVIYSDWLLWAYPRLTGHVAFDARFELLRHDELEDVATLRSSAANLSEVRRDYDVLVLDREFDKKVIEALSPSDRILYSDGRMVVVRA